MDAEIGFPSCCWVLTLVSGRAKMSVPCTCLWVWLGSVYVPLINISVLPLQGNFAQAGNSPQLRALSYYLILFPSLDVCSAYPLLVHAITNNIYTVFMGQDTTEKPKYRFDPILRLLLRFFAAIIPILAALGISNLVYVLKYAGLFGFGICFFFPTALQLQSIWRFSCPDAQGSKVQGSWHACAIFWITPWQWNDGFRLQQEKENRSRVRRGARGMYFEQGTFVFKVWPTEQNAIE